MIRRVIAYGDPLLRKQSEDIDENYPDVDVLINDMFETMKAAKGVGLAAPQIGLNINLFVMDSSPVAEKDKGLRKVFINPEIIETWGEEFPYDEGCLSVPKIREDVVRNSEVKLRYFDENFVEQEENFDDINARIIQHEYDHLDGILFIDKVSALKKRLLRNKLSDISKGNVEVDYPMKFPQKVKKKVYK